MSEIAEEDDLELVEDPSTEPSDAEIQARISAKIIHPDAKQAVAEKQWKRNLKPSGTGAFRVRTFYGRMREEGLKKLDAEINDWFDDNPDHEIKNVTTSIGEMVFHKTAEPALVVNIWM